MSSRAAGSPSDEPLGIFREVRVRRNGIFHRRMDRLVGASKIGITRSEHTYEYGRSAAHARMVADERIGAARAVCWLLHVRRVSFANRGNSRNNSHGTCVGAGELRCLL